METPIPDHEWQQLPREPIRRGTPEWKRRNQNALSALMMIGMLFLVILTNRLFTKCLTEEWVMPGLEIAGKKPDLSQLNLDAFNSQKAKTRPTNLRLSNAMVERSLAKQLSPLAQGILDPPSEEKRVAEAKAAVALQYASRLDYLAFTILYVLLALLTLPIGVYVMFNTLRVYPPMESSVWDAVKHNPGIVGTAILALITAIAGACFATSHAEDLDQFLLQTIQQDLIGSPTLLYSIFNGLSMGVTLYLAVVAICVMWHSRIQPFFRMSHLKIDEAEYEIETEARYMEVQLKQLRLVLYIGTVVLVARIIQISVGMDWALSYITPQSGPLYENVKNLVHSFVLIRAMYHTTLLAAIYLPTAAVLSERIAKLADRARPHPTPKERKAWLDRHGLNFNYMAQVPNLIAILGPLLATPVNALLSHIGGH